MSDKDSRQPLSTRHLRTGVRGAELPHCGLHLIKSAPREGPSSSPGSSVGPGEGGSPLVQQAGQSVWGGEQSILLPGGLGSFWSSEHCIEFLSSGSKTPLMFGCSIAGRSPRAVLDQHRQELLNEGGFFPIYFHQEDVEVNTCHRRAGKDQGMIPVQAQPLGRDRAAGTCSQPSFLLSATFPVALLHPWTEQRALQP